jgi:hypothetical protein
MAPDPAGAGALAAQDQEALELRRRGRAFGTIAAELGMDRSSDANLAFNRALRRQPAVAREQIRADENRRLDRMADAVRANAALTEGEATKRLRAIDLLRARLMAD